jgi:pyridoxamine 5'-phosphate oxidase
MTESSSPAPELDPSVDPIVRFAAWLEEAKAAEPNDPEAMAVATVGEDGMPSVRMVLLKAFDARGFVFYTNFESKKGRQALAHRKAALLFHWKTLRRQVRVEGRVEIVSEAEADAYFNSRPRASRIGAWASDQSRPMDGRWTLEKRVAEYALKFGLGEIPRPKHWSGFRVTPALIEFWHDRPFRLHERLVHHREDAGWRTERQFP